MSNAPTLLPFRFYNFNKKNQFLKVVQQKGFEVISENQTIINSVTTGSHQGGSFDTNSYSVKTKTENVVAYDIGIKKILDNEDKKYIDLLAEYLNYSGEKHFGFIGGIILGYVLGFILVVLLGGLLEILPFPKSIDNFAITALASLFWITGPTFYIYIYKKDKKIEGEKRKNYQTKLKPYLEGISF